MKILSLLLKPNEFTRDLVVTEGTEAEVEIVDLSRGNANYDELLKKIFAADAVQVI